MRRILSLLAAVALFRFAFPALAREAYEPARSAEEIKSIVLTATPSYGPAEELGPEGFTFLYNTLAKAAEDGANLEPGASSGGGAPAIRRATAPISGGCLKGRRASSISARSMGFSGWVRVMKRMHMLPATFSG